MEGIPRSRMVRRVGIQDRRFKTGKIKEGEKEIGNPKGSKDDND